MKECSKCDTEKGLSEFLPSPAGADGLTLWCQDCNDANPDHFANSRSVQARFHVRVWMNSWRGAAVLAVFGDTPNRVRPTGRAYSTIVHAVNMAPEPRYRFCDVCGDAEVHRHHEDYDRPTDFLYLCPVHHHALHWIRRFPNRP